MRGMSRSGATRAGHPLGIDRRVPPRSEGRSFRRTISTTCAMRPIGPRRDETLPRPPGIGVAWPRRAAAPPRIAVRMFRPRPIGWRPCLEWEHVGVAGKDTGRAPHARTPQRLSARRGEALQLLQDPASPALRRRSTLAIGHRSNVARAEVQRVRKRGEKFSSDRGVTRVRKVLEVGRAWWSVASLAPKLLLSGRNASRSLSPVHAVAVFWLGQGE